MSRIVMNRLRLAGVQVLLLAGVLAASAVLAGWYTSPAASSPASQSPLPVQACQETITLSDGSEELLAIPGCAEHHRQQVGTH
ncbi:MAG: hypothetical protein ACOY3E_11215 [Pseudomonadota bacterium]